MKKAATEGRRFALSHSPHHGRLRRRRRGLVLIVTLAAMMLLLLLLGGLARRAVLEQRAIDSRREALQADWLLWSSEQRWRRAWEQEGALPEEWRFEFDDSAPGNSVSARVFPQEAPPDAPPPDASSPPRMMLEMYWTTPQGVTMERSRLLVLPTNPQVSP